MKVTVLTGSSRLSGTSFVTYKLDLARADHGKVDITEPNQWFAKITVAYKQIFLGRFHDDRSVAQAYDKAARKHFGAFARCNLEAAT